MIKKILMFLFMLYIPFFVSALQVNDEILAYWNMSDDDYITTVKKTNDGGYVIIGNTYSVLDGVSNFGKMDGFIIKYDKNWNVEWQNKYGGNNTDWIEDVIVTNDDEYYVLVKTYSSNLSEYAFQNSSDAVLVKYDKDGNIIWERFLAGDNEDVFSSGILTDDGGVIVAGNSMSTNIDWIKNDSNNLKKFGVVIKYSKDGVIEWKKNYNDFRYMSFNYITNSLDEGYLLVGLSSQTNQYSGDALFLKINKNGDNLDFFSWGGSSTDSFDRIVEVSDGYILMGSSNSKDISGIENKGGTDGVLIKLDKSRNVMWQKNFGGSSYDDFMDMQVQKNGLIFVVCNTMSQDISGVKFKGGNYDTIILRYDFNGNLLGLNSNGGNASDYFTTLICDNFNECLFAGYTSSTDIDGLVSNESDIIVLSLNFNYDALVNENIVNGYVTVSKKDNLSIINTFPNPGYIVDNISVKDSVNNEISINAEEENVYSFELYDDVNIDVTFGIDYNIEKHDSINGTINIEKSGSSFGLIRTFPDDGYEVDKIIVKDAKGNEIEVVMQEDGVYLFELYDDVSVEVLFKEKLVNPKTGVSSFVGIMFTLLVISLSGFFIIKNYNHSYEL